MSGIKEKSGGKRDGAGRPRMDSRCPSKTGSVIILGDLTFAIKVYLCVMQRKQVDYKSVLSLFLPQGILDYFDIVDYSDMGSYYLISLEERKVIPLEHSHMKLVSKGFFPETVITDFPARDRTVYLNLRAVRVVPRP